MKIQELINAWEVGSSSGFTQNEYAVRLPLKDAARLHALKEMYPRQSMEAIISELLSAALEELECSFPYIEGNSVISHDELGDPVFEDVGPTPKYLKLIRKHMDSLEATSTKETH